MTFPEKTVRRKGFMGWVERVGDKFPHPANLNLYIIVAIIIASFLLSIFKVSAINPTDGETIVPVNLLSLQGLTIFITNFIKNYQNYPVMGIVLILGMATGVCERSGFFSNAIKMLLGNANGNAVVFVISFIGVIANNAADSAAILIPLLAAAIFKGVKRNPIAGLFLGYASVLGGYTTSVIPGAWDALLFPMTMAGAHQVDPNFTMPLLSSYFPLLVAAISTTIVCGVVTIRIIEPMLGKYEGEVAEEDANIEVSDEDRRAVKKAGINALIILGIIVAVCIPKNSFMRSAEGSLMVDSVLMSSLSFFIVLIFAVMGFTYAKATKQISSISDAIGLMVEAVKPMGMFIALAVIISQMLFLFNVSNLGKILAINGGSFLASLPVHPVLIIVLFYTFITILNIFMGGGLPKYILLAPIIVPMLMQLNISPAFTQVIYRLGDCTTNNITPLTPYFAMLLAAAQNYDKKVGMGTLFTAMTPYTIGFFITYSLILIIWVLFNLPVGFGGTVFLN